MNAEAVTESTVIMYALRITVELLHADHSL